MTTITNTTDGLRRFWHPVATSVEIGAEPRRVLVAGTAWALARDGAGRIMAAADRCPHRLAPLSAGRVLGDEWQCGYHGWRFDGTGRCTAIPALGEGSALPPRARLALPAGVEEAGGLVWLAPDEPVAPRIDLDGTAGPHLRTIVLDPTTATVGAGPMIDNFCDVAHFPFVHAATFGGDEPAVVDGMDVEESTWGATCVIEHDFLNREDPGVGRGERPMLQRRRMTFRYAAPFSATLRLDHLDTGLVTVLLFGVQPQDDDHCRLYTVLTRGGDPTLVPDDSALAAAAAYEQRVLEEDLAVQTRMPRGLPVGPGDEVQTRADRFTLALRRVLARCAETSAVGIMGGAS